MKRLLSIGIIILFIGMAISSFTGNTVKKVTIFGNIITVDGDGDYTSIQIAVSTLIKVILLRYAVMFIMNIILY